MLLITEDLAKFNAGAEPLNFTITCKNLFTTGIGITVGLSSVQHNGNAAFPGITTLGKPGAGSDANGRIDCQ